MRNFLKFDIKIPIIDLEYDVPFMPYAIDQYYIWMNKNLGHSPGEDTRFMAS